MSGRSTLIGSSDRATSVIGRAIRLTMINLMDVRPGHIDRSTLGHPGKFSYCIAEDEENSPGCRWLKSGIARRALLRHRDGRDGAAPAHERVDDKA